MERCGSGTWVARRDGIVGLASTKTVEIVAPKSSLTPCILDDDPAQLEMLSAVIADMGYEAIPTSDPEEAPKRSLDEVAALYDQRRRVRALEEQLLKDLEFHGIIGKGPAMLEVFDFARKVERHYTNVLLVGRRERERSWSPEPSIRSAR